jgi:preprotein translocase subunit SecA
MSRLLKARRIPHDVLNAKAHEREAIIVAQAGRLGAVTVATNMAGRGTDIVLGGNAEYLAREETAKYDTAPEPEMFGKILDVFRMKCGAEHDEVVACGGLRIIGVERHESRRIDNQLRGRSGRQGDPGESRFYIALEDDLVRLFAGEKAQNMIQSILTKAHMEEGMAIEHSLLTRQIEGAQKKIESMYFDMRKQLLSFDDVMNQHRETIYGERDGILAGDDIKERTWGIIEDTLSSVLEHLFDNAEEPDFKGVGTRLKALFWPGFEKNLDGVDDPSALPGAEEKMKDELRTRFGDKVAELGEENVSRIFRFVMLQVLDTAWREHLLGLDELRRGIGLRAIGQKDPLIEYQRESYSMFEQMLQTVREKVTEFALRVRVVSREKSASRSRVTVEGRSSLLPPRTEGAAAGDSRPQPLRHGPKVGRNAPCPCGSGKKYKFCCGASRASHESR